jgi:hypothetical protein
MCPRLAPLLVLLTLFSIGPARAGELPDDWLAFESELVTVHVPRDARRSGSTLSAEADEVVLGLMALSGLESPPARVHAWIARTRDQFRTIQPREPPQWAAGTAYPERNLLFVALDTHGQKTPRQVFVHELAHVVLHWSYGEVEPPRWLEEGLAQVVAGEFDLQTQAILSRAALGSGLIPLSSLTTSWPSEPGRARIAYAESRDLVLFLRARHGDAVLGEIVQQMAAGTSAHAAIEASTGERMEELESAWSSRLRRRYAWLPVLGGSGTFWSIAAVLMLLGWARRLGQKKRRLAEMGAQEEALDEIRRDAWEPEAGRTPLWSEPRKGPPTAH